MGSILHIVSPEQFATPLFYILSGGTNFGAFFLAPEYTTSPANRIPMLIYGFLGGVLLLLIRAFSVYSDGLIWHVSHENGGHKIYLHQGKYNIESCPDGFIRIKKKEGDF